MIIKDTAKSICRGRAIVHSNERYRDSRNTLGDVLFDLMNWAQGDGIDFEAELNYAREAHAQHQLAFRMAGGCSV